MARRFRPSCGRCELFATWNRCSLNFRPLRAGGCGRGSWVRFEVGVWWSCDVTEITLMPTRSLFPDVFSVQSTSSNKFPSWEKKLGKISARLVRSMIFHGQKNQSNGIELRISGLFDTCQPNSPRSSVLMLAYVCCGFLLGRISVWLDFCWSCFDLITSEENGLAERHFPRNENAFYCIPQPWTT